MLYNFEISNFTLVASCLEGASLEKIDCFCLFVQQHENIQELMLSLNYYGKHSKDLILQCDRLLTLDVGKFDLASAHLELLIVSTEKNTAKICHGEIVDWQDDQVNMMDLHGNIVARCLINLVSELEPSSSFSSRSASPSLTSSHHHHHHHHDNNATSSKLTIMISDSDDEEEEEPPEAFNFSTTMIKLRKADDDEDKIDILINSTVGKSMSISEKQLLEIVLHLESPCARRKCLKAMAPHLLHGSRKLDMVLSVGFPDNTERQKAIASLNQNQHFHHHHHHHHRTHEDESPSSVESPSGLLSRWSPSTSPKCAFDKHDFNLLKVLG